MGNTSIQWTDKTWSPLRVRVRNDAAGIALQKGYSSLVPIAFKMAGRVGPHCEHVSPGCEHCYAGTNNHRCLPANGTGLPYDRRSRDLVEPFVHGDILKQPLGWRSPSKIFVENQSDLFGEWWPVHLLDYVFAIMSQSPKHTFQILTKRPEAMRAYIEADRTPDGIDEAGTKLGWCHSNVEGRWPLPNVWLGVSVEDQKTADERIPMLLRTPATTRFVSYEPALGPVDFNRVMWSKGWMLSVLSGVLGVPDFSVSGKHLNWVIVGGESGPGARPFDIQWARNTVRQCGEAGVPVFIKQLGAQPRLRVPGCTSGGCDLRLADRKGGDMSEWPEDLRVREFPTAKALEAVSC